jgi:hypothetical protein
VKSLLSRAALLVLALAAVISTAAAKPSEAVRNPSKVEYATQREAMLAASLYARSCGGSLIITSGTKSMEPLIHGKVYAVIAKRAYGSVTKSELLVYQGRANAAKADRQTMLHRAVLHDKDGWIMSGDNNRWTESWDRVTSDNYVGTVVALFAFPQA